MYNLLAFLVDTGPRNETGKRKVVSTYFAFNSAPDVHWQRGIFSFPFLSDYIVLHKEAVMSYLAAPVDDPGYYT